MVGDRARGIQGTPLSLACINQFVYTNSWKVEFQLEYEPYMVVPTARIPRYDERFVGYGFDKASPLCEQRFQSDYVLWHVV